MKRINVLTVDDNNVMAAGLAQLFSLSKVINYRGNVDSPEKCLQRLETDRMIDILLVDGKFPKSDMDGIQLVKEIRKKFPFKVENGKARAPRIIFFSVYSDYGYVDPENGIHGVIPKNASFNRIEGMIVDICNARASYHPEAKKGAPIMKAWEMLTSRQRQILCLITKESLTTKEIADNLALSTLTVQTHRKNILQKIRKAGIEVDKIDDFQVIKAVKDDNLCANKK